MGSLGGSSWNAPQLPLETIMLTLVSPTVSPDNTNVNANSLFRTGISTQLAPQIAMAIWGVTWNIGLGAHSTPVDKLEDVIGVLTEDIGGTNAGDELNDPRTLAVAGTQREEHTGTAVGEIANDTALLWPAVYNPPIWTIAQQLNLIGSIIEITVTAAVARTIFCEIFYTLSPISTAFSTKLIQRLNLSTQP